MLSPVPAARLGACRSWEERNESSLQYLVIAGVNSVDRPSGILFCRVHSEPHGRDQYSVTAIPISAANCPADCVGYPYLDTVPQYPRDFL